MFECRACAQRCIRAIFPNTFHTTRSLSSPGLPARRRPLATPRRQYASTAREKRLDTTEDKLVPGKQPQTKNHSPGSANRQDGEHLSGSEMTALKTELRYLQDPVKLAEHVHYTLRCDNPEKALNLCRLASREQEVIVSWNHCIDWHMKRGRINAAIRIYNEMKKRAQFPDSYTYVLLLRGLARPHTPLWPTKVQSTGEQEVRAENVTKAISIYNSLSSPTSRVKPNTFHTNAVLKVCSEAQDMDALWGVVSKIPEHGQGSADHITYAILLHALRHGAFGKGTSPYAETIAARRQEAVRHGRSLWREVTSKWRAGEVQIDEALVVAMGRLLIFSRRMQDWDDVFSLVRQTMNIERLVAPLGAKDRHVDHVPMDEEVKAASTETEMQEDIDGYKETSSAKVFNPINALPSDPSKPNRATSFAYVEPGNAILQILVNACAQLHIPKTADAYWSLFMKPRSEGGFGLVPDRSNFHMQLQVFAKNRASAKAVALLKEQMVPSGVELMNRTFRVAMAVCVRDKNNPNALKHAREVVDLMEQKCDEPDVHTLRNYLFLAIGTRDGPQIVDTLDHLDPIIHNLKSKVTFGSERSTLTSAVVDKKDTLEFFDTVIGTFDMILQQKLIHHKDVQHWLGRRQQLAEFLGRVRKGLNRQTKQLQRRGSRLEVFGAASMDSSDVAERVRSLKERNRLLGLRIWKLGRARRSPRLAGDNPFFSKDVADTSAESSGQ